LGWTKARAGRAIDAWQRGAARTADLADLRRAVRNMLAEWERVEGRWVGMGSRGCDDARLLQRKLPRCT
jgi:hypothetical protein